MANYLDIKIKNCQNQQIFLQKLQLKQKIIYLLYN